MPNISQSGTRFLVFLRTLYFKRTEFGGSKIGSETVKNPYSPARTDVLSKIVARHLGNGAEDDHDALAAARWQEKIARWEREIVQAMASAPELRSGLRDHYNREHPAEAHLKNFAASKRQAPDPEQLVNRPWFAQAVTAAAFSLVLAVALGKMNPDLVRRINSFGDRILRGPSMTVAYLLGTDELLAKDRDLGLVKNPAPDKNILSSYIANNRGRLAIDKGSEKAFLVTPEQLDGRVAGAYERDGGQASDELVRLSSGSGRDRGLAKAAVSILDKVAGWQIKASDWVYSQLAGQ